MKRFVFLFTSSLILLAVSGNAKEGIDRVTMSQTNIAIESPATQTSQIKPGSQAKSGEVSIVNPKTGISETHNVYGTPPKSLTNLYMEGGYICMSMITICLIAMLFSTWKAPRWIKEIGLIALLIGLFYFILGIYEISDLLYSNGYEIGKDLSANILFGGLRVSLIAPMYGMIVYGISLLLRIAVKPRI